MRTSPEAVFTCTLTLEVPFGPFVPNVTLVKPTDPVWQRLYPSPRSVPRTMENRHPLNRERKPPGSIINPLGSKSEVDNY